jgi:hypothetical protein
MGNDFMLVTKLAMWTSSPITLQQIIFSSNCILPYQPQPNLDFQRDYTLPQMLERSVQTITAQMFVN